MNMENLAIGHRHPTQSDRADRPARLECWSAKRLVNRITGRLHGKAWPRM